MPTTPYEVRIRDALNAAIIAARRTELLDIHRNGPASVFDAPLRAPIEGSFHDPARPLDHPIPPPARYSEWENAGRAVGVVGTRNAMAAFFLGRTDLIRMT